MTFAVSERQGVITKAARSCRCQPESARTLKSMSNPSRLPARFRYVSAARRWAGKTRTIAGYKHRPE